MEGSQIGYKCLRNKCSRLVIGLRVRFNRPFCSAKCANLAKKELTEESIRIIHNE